MIRLLMLTLLLLLRLLLRLLRMMFLLLYESDADSCCARGGHIVLLLSLLLQLLPMLPKSAQRRPRRTELSCRRQHAIAISQSKLGVWQSTWRRGRTMTGVMVTGVLACHPNRRSIVTVMKFAPSPTAMTAGEGLRVLARWHACAASRCGMHRRSIAALWQT